MVRFPCILWIECLKWNLIVLHKSFISHICGQIFFHQCPKLWQFWIYDANWSPKMRHHVTLLHTMNVYLSLSSPNLVSNLTWTHLILFYCHWQMKVICLCMAVLSVVYIFSRLVLLPVYLEVPVSQCVKILILLSIVLEYAVHLLSMWIYIIWGHSSQKGMHHLHWVHGHIFQCVVTFVYPVFHYWRWFLFCELILVLSLIFLSFEKLTVFCLCGLLEYVLCWFLWNCFFYFKNTLWFSCYLTFKVSNCWFIFLHISKWDMVVCAKCYMNAGVLIWIWGCIFPKLPGLRTIFCQMVITTIEHFIWSWNHLKCTSCSTFYGVLGFGWQLYYWGCGVNFSSGIIVFFGNAIYY